MGKVKPYCIWSHSQGYIFDKAVELCSAGPVALVVQEHYTKHYLVAKWPPQNQEFGWMCDVFGDVLICEGPNS